MVSHAVDVHVGNRLRARRIILGISQESLGDAVGVTFQQIQKYEKGVNRIGASRLFEFSCILKVPVDYFFEEYLDAKTTSTALAEDVTPFEHEEQLSNREILSLVRAYSTITEPSVRKQVLSLVKTLGGETK